MDLGAFLRPGGVISAIMAPVEPADFSGPVNAEPLPVILAERRGRPLWLAGEFPPAAGQVTVTLALPGYSLAADGSLEAAGTGSEATLILLGRIRNCRFFPLLGRYVLRLELLGRIYPG